MEDILELREAIHNTEEDVRRIVQNDTKGRFSIRTKHGNLQIKATQGHSFKVISKLFLQKDFVPRQLYAS